MMNKPTPWIALLLVVIAGAAWYFFRPQAPEEHPSVVSTPIAETVTVEPTVSHPVEDIPVAEEPPPEPLPTLAESDQPLLDALMEMLGAEVLEQLFMSEQVISRIVTTIDALDSRQLAPLVMPVRPPSGNFQTLGGEVITIHSDNAARYEPYVRVAFALDMQRMVDLYVYYYPLFQQAYDDLGYTGRHFNDRLVEIIDHLLATPRPREELKLVKPEAVYLFEDPDLEALSAGQKLLLRIGTRNAAVILGKLQELRAAIVR